MVLDGVTLGCRGADFWSRVSPQLASQTTRLDELAQAVTQLRQRLHAAGSPVHAFREPVDGPYQAPHQTSSLVSKALELVEDKIDEARRAAPGLRVGLGLHPTPAHPPRLSSA